MVSVYEDYREFAARQKQRELAQTLLRTVEDALHPFKPLGTTIHVSDTVYGMRSYNISFENLPSLNFSPSLSVEHVRELLFGNEIDIFRTVNELVYDHLTNRPRIVPEDNIILGED